MSAEHATGDVIMENGALIHTYKVATDWLREMEIEGFGLYSRSADLNPMENMWGIVARKVYADGRQLKTIISLRECLASAWAELGEDSIAALFNSMRQRWIVLIERKGLNNKY